MRLRKESGNAISERMQRHLSIVPFKKYPSTTIPNAVPSFIQKPKFIRSRKKGIRKDSDSHNDSFPMIISIFKSFLSSCLSLFSAVCS